MGKIEILAPAGSFDALKAAVAAGADAVYAGGSRFGARAYAANFTEEELLEAIDYVHLYGKKLFLTVNTLVKEKEYGDLYDYLKPYYCQGLDAVIVQDLGVMEFIKKHFPKMDIHASTQMTITNVRSAKYLEDHGVERVVPARELSLKEIRQISEATDLEIECFVHGALCYCYSGQCLMSSMIGGRSGNRGQCAQPCRLSYTPQNQKKALDILSLKDLCTIENIPDLVDAGITSFKIEGRMKHPSYVAVVAGMYRKYTDLYLEKGRKGFKVSEADKKRLLSVFQRRGYCDGYYYKHNGKEMISFEEPSKDRDVSWQEEEAKKIGISGYLYVCPEQDTVFSISCGDISLSVTGEKAQHATKQPMTEERISKQMKKTGGTPFAFDDLFVDIQGEVFLPVQSLNDLRRRALQELEEQLTGAFRREEFHPEETEEEVFERMEKKTLFSASVETMDQLRTVSEHEAVGRIFVEDALYIENDRETVKDLIHIAHENGKEVWFAMARIFRLEAEKVYNREFEELSETFDGILARNPESYLYLRERGYEGVVMADAGVYQWNKEAKKYFKQYGFAESTAPVELNYRELAQLGIEDMELVVYGYLPVMVSANCVKKSLGKCDHKSGSSWMADRYQKRFPMKNTCSYCYNVIYNIAPMVLLDQQEEIQELAPRSLRLSFTMENKKQTKEMLDLYERAFMKGEKVESPDIEFTRGHFKRGVK